MATIPITQAPANLNTTDKYIIVTGRTENFTYFAWTPDTIASGAKNILGGGSANLVVSMSFEGKTATVQRQNSFNAQNVAQQSTIITTIETSTYKGRTISKKKSFSFPRRANIIWITYVLNKNIDKTKVKAFKGVPTYKRGTGGRFIIGNIPDAAMTASVNKYIAAIEAARTARNESTTTAEVITQT